MPSRSAPRKISEKKLKALGGRVPFSTITAKPKPIKKVNVERQAKVKALGRKKHAGYRRSETYNVVQKRAAGQCEFTVTYHAGGTTQQDRCDETEGLEHHHKRYGRQYGGNERPEDMLVLCKQHHNYYESLKPTRRHGR